MDEDIKTDIALIKFQMESINSQIQRFISHLESEQRVTSNISKRVDALENMMKWMQDANVKKENNSKWKIETIISLMALAGTMAALFLRN